MSKVDGRKISHAVREQIRFKAINEWLQGLSGPALAIKYGTSKKIVYQWIARYQEGGFDGLKTKPGIGRGQKSRLTVEQKAHLSLLLRTRTPKDYGYATELWTCVTVAQLIKDEFQVSYTPASLSSILRKLGFTPRNPRWGAWQQDSKKNKNG